ncbi:pyroglutamyl-peptidase I [Quadrisphaera oryzae]|uniref:pyroglutamyl-peptidase I n=1 Tax=Quadrisphaera TaxID=317661 RepID=UPI001647520A|nr:pyroglutamyl-peptidase I [Quadrisphaera sp. RL12-1S]MBC3763957.1 pyroglutamyl-peptidase I [Quadrisphaera sp. RL12-1S]
MGGVDVRPTRVLLTGFEPFAGDEANPSWPAAQRAAELLASDPAGPARRLEAHTRLLPVEFGRSADLLRAAVREVRPAVVVCAGLAGGTEAVRVERVAVNLDDARIPDGAGRQPVDVPSVPGGPAAWFATLPVKAAVRAVVEAGVPAQLSASAGGFVCNHVFAALMHHLSEQDDDERARGGFVHLPWASDLPHPPDAPTLPLEQLARALAAVVRAALEHRADLRVPGGALH